MNITINYNSDMVTLRLGNQRPIELGPFKQIDLIEKLMIEFLNMFYDANDQMVTVELDKIDEDTVTNIGSW